MAARLQRGSPKSLRPMIYDWIHPNEPPATQAVPRKATCRQLQFQPLVCPCFCAPLRPVRRLRQARSARAGVHERSVTAAANGPSCSARRREPRTSVSVRNCSPRFQARTLRAVGYQAHTAGRSRPQQVRRAAGPGTRFFSKRTAPPGVLGPTPPPRDGAWPRSDRQGGRESFADVPQVPGHRNRTGRSNLSGRLIPLPRRARLRQATG